MNKRRLRAAVLAVAALAAAALLVVSLRNQYADVRDRLGELHVWAIVGAVSATVAAGGATMQAWRAVLTDLGSPLGLLPSSRVFFLGQLGKYLPGSVWSVVGQMELATRYHVPRARSVTAGVLTLVVGVLSGLFVAAALLPGLAGRASAQYWPAFLALPVTLVVLYPPVINRLVGRALTLTRRQPMELPASWRGVGAATGWCVGSWLLFGVALWLLARDVGSGGARALGVCIGGFALAWAAGFLVVVVPAGAGIREAVLVAVLSSGLTMPAGAPLLLALVMRLATTLGDVALGLMVIPAARRQAAGATDPDEAPSPPTPLTGERLRH